MGHDGSCCVAHPTQKSEAGTATDAYSRLTLPSFLESSSPSSESSTSASSASELFTSAGLLTNEASPLFESRCAGDSTSIVSTSSSQREPSSSHLDGGSLLNIPSPILEEDLGISMHEFDDVDRISGDDLDLDMKPCLDETCPSDGCCRADSGCDDDHMFMSRLEELLRSDTTQEFVAESGLASMSDLFPDLTGGPEFCAQDDMSAWSSQADTLQGFESSSFLNTEDVHAAPSSTYAAEEESASQMFARWLQNNAHWVSLSDLRKIKLKTSTIENVTKRLGGGKKGLMLFLKFVLMWVQNSRSSLSTDKGAGIVSPSVPHTTTSPASSFLGTTGMAVESASRRDTFGARESPGVLMGTKPPMHSFSGSPTTPLSGDWTSSRAQGTHTSLVHPNISMPMPRSYSSITNSSACSPLPSPNFCQPNSAWLHQSSNVVRGVCPSSMSPSLQSLTRGSNSRMGADVSSMMMSMQQPHCADATPAATTRAARKSRMERQRWSVRRNRKWSVASQHHRMAAMAPSSGSGHSSLVSSWSQSPGNAMQKPAYSSSLPCQQNAKVTNTMEYQQQNKRPERNLKLLFHKELKQSDVGSLGRIVLPKAAETCLPPLESRDGVNLLVDDINSTKVWNMRYRFWPNNKSRMYLLENTSDFVKLYDLKEGDYMMMYLDNMSNKYVIRGVKGSGVQSATLAGSNNSVHAGEKRRRSLTQEITGGATNSEDSCDESLLVELIEQSLEDLKES